MTKAELIKEAHASLDKIEAILRYIVENARKPSP